MPYGLMSTMGITRICYLSNQSVPQHTDGTPHRFKVRTEVTWQQAANTECILA